MLWKKKKVLGSVTIFGEDDESAANRFYDLGTRGLDSEDCLGHLSAAQIRQLALQSACAGKESTQKTLKIVHEIREVGTSTANTLQKQTAQLENVETDCEVVKNYLEKSEGKL